MRFLAAFRLPNLIRRVLREGGLNPAFVPVLARLKPEEARAFAGEAFAGLGLVLVALVGLIELLAGLIVAALAPGLADDAATLALATSTIRLASPLIVGVTLASFVAALLNHHRRYAAAAVAPLVVNGALIGALLVVRYGVSLAPAQQALWLAGAVSLSGFLQLALVGLALRRDRGALLRLTRPRWSPALAGLVASACPALVAGARRSCSCWSGRRRRPFSRRDCRGSTTPTGWPQLPLGIIASAAGVVLLPELAAGLAAGQRQAVIAAQNRALELALLIALPAAVALACLAAPIASVLFERGAFGPEDSRGTAAALVGLSVGLPFAVVGKVLLAGAVRGRQHPGSPDGDGGRASWPPPPHPTGSLRCSASSGVTSGIAAGNLAFAIVLVTACVRPASGASMPPCRAGSGGRRPRERASWHRARCRRASSRPPP